MAPKGLGVSSTKAWFLLFIFSMAQVLDIVNVSAPVIALPYMTRDLNLLTSEGQWILNAYTLTFGAFLLVGGRFSAVYGPKALFLAGFATVGVGSLINGFAVNGPMLFVIRALQGVGAALTIPSAVTMIVLLFPNRTEQDRALGIFAGLGAAGHVGGLVIGGIISEKIGWKWSFWIMAMTVFGLSVATFIFSPSPAPSRSSRDVYKNMDWFGLFFITACILLFIFAVTEGNVKGWTSKEVLPPLIISIFLLPVFAYIETVAKEPLIPPWTWSLPTFTPLFFIVLSEYSYMNIITFQMSDIFQQVWKVSAISAAVRIIPFGMTSVITTSVIGAVAVYISPRWLLTGGHALVLAGTVLLTYGSSKDQYWSKVFPGFILSCCGLATTFVSSNIAMLRTPLLKPGIDVLESTALVGAIFNASLQIGSSVGLAIVTAITNRVNGPDSDSTNNGFEGYRAGLWFVVGVAGFESLLALVSLGGKHEHVVGMAAAAAAAGEKEDEETKVGVDVEEVNCTRTTTECEKEKECGEKSIDCVA